MISSLLGHRKLNVVGGPFVVLSDASQEQRECLSASYPLSCAEPFRGQRQKWLVYELASSWGANKALSTAECVMILSGCRLVEGLSSRGSQQAMHAER